MDTITTMPNLCDASWVVTDHNASRLRAASTFLQRDLSDDALRLPPEQLFTKTELVAAGQDAFGAGREAGLAQAGAAQAACVAQALASVAEALHRAAEEAGRVADQAAASLARVLVASLNTVMPDLVERSGQTEAVAMLAELLPGLSREPHVQVSVPRAVVPGVEAALTALASEQRDRIILTGSDNLGPGEVSVSWAAGHATRRPGQVWQAVMSMLEKALDELPN